MGERFKLKKISNEKSKNLYRLENKSDTEIPEVTKFLECISLTGASPRTIVSYGYDLLYFYTWIDESQIKFQEITEYDLYKYISYQKEKHAAPRSINRRLATCMQFYRFCFGKEMPSGIYTLRPASFYKGQTALGALGILPQKRVKKLLRVKVPHKLVAPLNIDEVKKFIQGIKRCRDLAIVYLMLHCGLRSIEILNLKENDLSVLRRQLLIRGKGEKQRMVHLPSFVVQILEKYQCYEKPKVCFTDAFFVVLKGKKRGHPMTRSGLREIFRYRRKRSGVGKANPHRFRHTFGADMVRAGMSLVAVKELMGHQDIDMTIHYVNLSQNDIRDEFSKATEKIKERYGQNR